MRMRDVLPVLNQLRADGVVQDYAIGGAVAAAFFSAPVSTEDVDVFVAFEPEPGSLLISPRKIYEYFQTRGHVFEREHVIIAGWPVQFLPPTGPLVEEALERAIELLVDENPVRVFRPEYLAAIALQVGRAKDYARVSHLLEAQALDLEVLEELLARHQLVDRWERFRLQFGS